MKLNTQYVITNKGNKNSCQEKQIQQKVIFITMANFHQVKWGPPNLIQPILLDAKFQQHGILHKTCWSRGELYSTMEKYVAHHIFVDELNLKQKYNCSDR